MKFNLRGAVAACTIVVSASLVASSQAITQGETQTETPISDKPSCQIDLSQPGQMADIASNALVLEFEMDEGRVREFFEATKNQFASGKLLATATAKKFGIDNREFFAAIESYKHVNCGRTSGRYQSGSHELSPFAEDVLVHVIAHEIGHALIREFDLPILGNEETAADRFATHYIVTRMEPNRGLQILQARVASLMFEANEVTRDRWTVRGEHNSDARRAYQIAAAAIAHDASTFGDLAALVEMSDSDIRRARDYGSEIHRSWRRTLKPLTMPQGQRSNEARMLPEAESDYYQALLDSKMLEELRQILQSFDWHSQVTLSFTGGDGGAGWSRSTRTITVQDGYIKRFNAQAKSITSVAATENN